jgi:C_GCAxxG_C_C family probable redox protein
MRAMGAFGGGLGANGEVCGAVVGGLAVLGLRFSRAEDDENEDLRIWSYTRELLWRFANEITKGSIYCRDIAKVDWTNMERIKRFYKSDALVECQRITGETARVVGELLDRAEGGEPLVFEKHT